MVELPRERPDPALELFWDVPDLRILVVGGDGTVGWILSCLDRIEHAKDGGAATGWQQPPIAMLPLGTGPLRRLVVDRRRGSVSDPMPPPGTLSRAECTLAVRPVLIRACQYS